MLRPTHALALLSITALALAGCASSPAAEATGVSVVASTDVYGDIAKTIGGEHVTVTSIVSGAASDPHSYEATVRDQLALSKADLIVSNGGGYDPFIDTLLEANPTEAPVIVASEASTLLDGDAHEDDAHDDEAPAEDVHEGEAEDAHIEGFNEHVWYSFHGTGEVAHAIADELAKIDPDHAADFEQNLAAFEAEVEKLEARAGEIATSHDGTEVALTEPVPVYLLEAAGLHIGSPEEFSEAIEEGTDVSPTVMQQTLDLFANGTVKLLAYNSQTSSAETETVRAAAEAADVPVVEFGETLPDGADYVSWMTQNLEALASALEK